MSRMTKMGRAMAVLRQGAVSAHTLAAAVEVGLSTAQRWLRELHSLRIVHIVAWKPDSLGRDVTPVYALGSVSDVPRRKQTRAEISRRWRQRQKEQQHG